MKTVKNRLKSRRGESLIETLASMLIIVMGMTILAGAIVTAARLNRTAADYASFYGQTASTGKTVTVTVQYDSDSTTYSKALYKSNTGRLYHYE